MRRLSAILAALPLALTSGQALAQAYQCAPPPRMSAPRAPQPDGPTVRVPIAGYTLAVSWSPEFCRAVRQASTIQCGGTIGMFGFILHGLWPESRSGPPPQWCSITPRPSADLLRRNVCMTPSPGLLEHEWAKHGSCMARTPDSYIRTAGALWRSLRWPDADRLSRQQGLTTGDLRRAFAARNPDWKPEQVGVFVSKTGWLRELRLCYGRDFMPARCDRGKFGPRDSAPLKIWRGL